MCKLSYDVNVRESEKCKLGSEEISRVETGFVCQQRVKRIYVSHLTIHPTGYYVNQRLNPLICRGKGEGSLSCICILVHISFSASLNKQEYTRWTQRQDHPHQHQAQGQPASRRPPLSRAQPTSRRSPRTGTPRAGSQRHHRGPSPNQARQRRRPRRRLRSPSTGHRRARMRSCTMPSRWVERSRESDPPEEEPRPRANTQYEP